jgi:ribonuclease HI
MEDSVGHQDHTETAEKRKVNRKQKDNRDTVKVTAHRVPTPASDTAIAYTDGACSGNPGPAGLGYVVVFPDGKRIQRGEPLGMATNNIAELTAILRVLELIDNPSSPVVIHTDSAYSIGVLSLGWKAKANKELIFKIKQRLSQLPAVTLQKVKGHAGVPENELVDHLARMAAETQNPVDE